MQVGELFVRLGLDTSQFDAGMRQAEKKANNLGSILENALSFTLGMGLFEAIKQGFKAVVGEAVNFNSMMEQARIGFTTMLGSAERAQAFLNEMANFAKDTPFEFPELLESAKNMMAMGFSASEVLPTLKAVGDAAAGLGVGSEEVQRITRALTQMRAKSKVSAEEMLQLAEVGVPAWEILSEAMGKSTAEVMKLAERGLIPANIAIQALIDGMEKRFPNMMAKMQNTWQGITSALRDVWRMTIGAISSELFKGITTWLGRLRDMANNFYNAFTTLKQQGVNTATALKVAISYAFGADVGAIASTLINVVQSVWLAFVRAAVFIKTHWVAIRTILLSVVSAVLTFKVALPVINFFVTLTRILNGTLTATTGIFGFLSKAVTIYRTQLMLANTAGAVSISIFTKMKYAAYSLYAALGKVGLILLAVSAILSLFVSLWGKYVQRVEEANMEKMNAKLKDSLEKLEQGLGEIGNVSVDAGEGIGELGDEVKNSTERINSNLQVFDELHSLTKDTADIAGSLSKGIDFRTDSFTMPKFDIEDMFDFELEEATFKGFLDSLLNSLKEKLRAFSQFIKEWQESLKAMFAAFTLPPPQVPPPNTAPVTASLETVNTKIMEVNQNIRPWIADTLANVNAWAIAFGTLIISWSINVRAAFEQWALNTKTTVGAWVNAISSAISGWVANAKTAISNWVTTTVSSISNWVTNTRAVVLNWASTTANAINGWITSTRNVISNWVTTTATNFANWVTNVRTNISTWVTTARANIMGWINATATAIATWVTTTARNFGTWAATAGNNIYNFASSTYSLIYNWGKNSLTAFNTFLDATAKNVVSWATTVWHNLSSWAQSAFSTIANLASAIGVRVTNTVKSVVPALQSGFKAVGKWVNENKSWLIPVGIAAGAIAVGVATGGLGGALTALGGAAAAVPAFATGGIVTAPQIGIIGEAGPEAVIPLSKDNVLVQGIRQAVYEAVLQAISTARTTSGHETKEIVLTVNGREFARGTIEDFAEVARRLGIRFV